MCIRNKNHSSKETVCRECLENINQKAHSPALEDLHPSVRAIFSQVKEGNNDLTKCWRTSFTHITVNKKKWRVENLFYAFYKADQGNFALKRTCGTLDCVNPAHHRSRFEDPSIKTTVRTGFRRKTTSVEVLSHAQWVKQP